MKKRIFTRILSLLLVAAMVLGMIPMTAVETQAASDAPMDLNIQYDYREQTGIQNAQQELTSEANKGHKQAVNSTGIVWPDEGAFVTVKDGDFKVTGGGKFREYLEDSSNKYIRLMGNLKTTSSHTDYDVINITSDKVLDLNGYSIELYDSRNKYDTHDWWIDETYDQSSTPSDHMSYMFEISNGATLTIIDSGGYGDTNYTGARRTGRILANGRMLNHQKWDFLYYTHRDMFLILDGNLVIHGGEFQAGRQKDQYKSNFSWNKLKEVIGQAVTFGASVFEYASGISLKEAAEADLKKKYYDLEEAEKKKMQEEAESEEEASKPTASDSATAKKDGTGEDVAKDGKTETPASAGKGDKNAQKAQTVAQKQDEKNTKKEDQQNNRGDQSQENEANEDKTAKYEKNTKLAEAEKAIGDAILDKDKITGMLDSAFALGEGFIGLLGNNSESRATNCIQGTVAQVQNGGTLVVYGGKFIGHGSTPNVRNAVIEVQKSNVKYAADSAHSGKYIGGLVYIYGGTFEAYTGANVFNMIKENTNQKVTMRVKDENGNIKTEEITLAESETFGKEALIFEDGKVWDEWMAGWKKLTTDAQRNEYPSPERVNTANVVVRGGTFRCYYELSNMAILADKQEGSTKPEGSDDDYNHRKFIGTSGSVNLGVDSFGKDLIRDGRIQIVDVYGQGSLVLLDGGEPIGEKTSDTTLEGNTYKTEGGFRHYRLFVGDSELRSSSYLEVYPNEAATNSTFSLNLATYWGNGDEQIELWESDEENIRAPYSSNEKYIDFVYDDIQANNAGITPTYYVIPELDDMKHPTDVDLQTSKVWYYNTPLDAKGNAIKDVSYSSIYEVGKNASNDELYNSVADDNYRTNIKWFTYKVYRVDPLTRENISESNTWGVDEPLIEVVYGAKNDSLKCKLDLVDIANEIKARRGTNYWNGYKTGEMYRIEFSVEEKLGTGYQGNGKFLNEFEAKASSSILFLCSKKDELRDETYKDPQTGQIKERKGQDYTPMQFDNDYVVAGEEATVKMINGQTGMVDYEGAKVFDIYYQWYEVDKDGSDPRLIAGTDNVWIAQEATTAKQSHKPANWKIKSNGQGVNGEQYYNTVDPADPNASAYGANGLPKATSEWTYDMLHMYTYETVGKHDGMKLDQSKNLYIGNNNALWGNTDSCYIPESMVGKYIQVKAVAVNCRYPVVYDNLQTFTSHVIEVKAPVDYVDVKVDAPKEGNKADYTPEFPAGAKYKLNSTSENAVEWWQYKNGLWSVMGKNDTFEKGVTYRVDLELLNESGQIIHWNYTVPRINGCLAEWNGAVGDKQFGIYKDFYCRAKDGTDWIEELYVQVVEPVDGATPVFNAEVPFGADYMLDDEMEQYERGWVQWYRKDGTKWVEMNSQSTFNAGDIVKVFVYLTTKNGAKFDANVINAEESYYVNGTNTGAGFATNGNYQLYLELSREFTVPEPTVKRASLITIVSGVESDAEVTVELYKAGETTPIDTVKVTGSDRYVFDPLAEGDYTVKASCEGYKDYSEEVTVNGNNTVKISMVSNQIPEPTPTPETTPEVTPDKTPEVTPDKTPEETPEVTPDKTPEETPEVTPETTPEVKPTPTPEEKEEVCTVFADVKHGAWYETGVQYVYNKDLMSGSGNNFNPTKDISRAQLVTTLYRLAGSPVVTDKSALKDFTDVATGKYYTDAVCWAYAEGIATGNDGKFNPTGNLTRQQMAAFFYRFADYKGIGTAVKGDITTMLNADKVSGYAKEPVEWAVGAGLISGSKVTDANGNEAYDLKPRDNTTRAQVAVILQRFCENNGL